MGMLLTPILFAVSVLAQQFEIKFKRENKQDLILFWLEQENMFYVGVGTDWAVYGYKEFECINDSCHENSSYNQQQVYLNSNGLKSVRYNYVESWPTHQVDSFDLVVDWNNVPKDKGLVLSFDSNGENVQFWHDNQEVEAYCHKESQFYPVIMGQPKNSTDYYPCPNPYITFK